MKNWILSGIIAAVIIVLAIPFYAIKHEQKLNQLAQEHRPKASFVGRETCKSCHKKEYDDWSGSDHDNSMAVASEATVLGNFKDSVFSRNGVESRFFRKDDKFYVHTQGPEGRMGDFEISYTFGVYPLQQYLIAFSGGRYQCLPIAWNVENKNWYHLNGETVYSPDDWLYWTNQSMNWNGMCADCHSTHLKKGYDPETRSYKTSWYEIDVSCEACHGPGSVHTDWASLPAMARRGIDNYGLIVDTSDIEAKTQVKQCARCHSRRSQFTDSDHEKSNFLDTFMPITLDVNMYYPDGQILDEVYVYGSFTQSKMFNNNVKCSDCHNVHTGKVKQQDNQLCIQCHREDTYDTADHHFHKKVGERGESIKDAKGNIISEVGEGAKCIGCHMPGKYYMCIDYRRDHSLRRPRPDLTKVLNTPNACSECHVDKTIKWAIDYTTKWYGIKKRPHYGVTIANGRKLLPDAEADLIKLSDDVLYPVIARATALKLLQQYRGDKSKSAFIRALVDNEALMRYIAVQLLKPIDPKERIELIGPMLFDPVLAVRMEAAMNLTEVFSQRLGERYKTAFDKALKDYTDAMKYVGDFAYSGHNLGNMYRNLGKWDKAIESYLNAIDIDHKSYQTKVNLAMVYNQLGNKDSAEKYLRTVVDNNPELYQIKYSLALLLSEKNQFDEAVKYLRDAARGMPEASRIQYNLGRLLDSQGKVEEAEHLLLNALTIEPENFDYLYTLAQHYLKRKKLEKAKGIATKIISCYPKSPVGHDLLKQISVKR